MHELKTINEVCKMLGLTSRTIRYYEQLGLIVTKHENKNAPRRLDGENIERLRKIRFLRKLGISLDEIKSAVVSDETAAEMIRSKSAELSAEMAALDDRIRMLHVVLAAAEKGENIYDAEKKLHQPVDDPENLRIAETVTRLLAERRFAELPQYLDGEMKTMPPEFIGHLWDGHIKPCGEFVGFGGLQTDGSEIVSRLRFEKLGVKIRMHICGGVAATVFLQYCRVDETA